MRAFKSSFLHPICKFYFKMDYQGSVFLFTDNIKIFLRIDSSHSFHTFQIEFDNFLTWARYLELSLNLCKSNAITFTRCCNPILYQYNLNSTTIKRVFLFKDLGMYFSPLLILEYYINVTICRVLT